MINNSLVMNLYTTDLISPNSFHVTNCLHHIIRQGCRATHAHHQPRNLLIVLDARAQPHRTINGTIEHSLDPRTARGECEPTLEESFRSKGEFSSRSTSVKNANSEGSKYTLLDERSEFGEKDGERCCVCVKDKGQRFELEVF